MSKDKSNDRPAYEVGYGKPPKKHRFKKGKSGNPKGRVPQEKDNMYDILERLLYQKRKVRMGGSEKLLTNLEVVFVKLMEKALQGDMRAIHTIQRFSDKFNITPPKLEVIPPYLPTRAEIKAMDPDFNGENDDKEDDDL